ncbi:hypothetical protein [Alicyclobacillus mengziensis]|uniref:Lipoprotein n=1 Tax=Alicyclobacillus mengziensis TaxID=2931921 RepID=A0A9X7W377_9BACL|nr:hypothetical protein [Alicyclobacillus mengziensis]QSO48458.1 hypothetical protein JZ786_05570 [Alicyclobacillus mengziensis]
MKRGAFAISVMACLMLTGCSIFPKPAPKPSDYEVSFSMDNATPFVTAPKSQYQAQFQVTVTKWNQNFDPGKTEVFLIVTDKTAPVIDLESDNANNFAYGGWFNLSVENPVLKSLGLQPISTTRVPNNWFNVVNANKASARFVARTESPVNPVDWRFVIMATQGNQGKVKVLWTKVVKPS